MNYFDVEITRQNNDVIMKAMAETFRDKSLKFFGLRTPKIVDVIPTVLPIMEVKENRTDFVFLLEDNSYLHLEFQTTVSKEDLKRFALYDARIINKFDRDVNTAVIYSGRINTAPDRFKKGSLAYNVKNIYMKGYNGDKEYVKLKKKISKNIPLDEADTLKLIFLPLMKSEKSEDEMAVQAAELAKDMEGDIKTFVIAAIVAITDKFMSEEYKKKLLEVLRMTQIEQMIREEVRKECVGEGVEEGRKKEKTEIAVSLLKEGAEVDFVIKVTGLAKEAVQNLKNAMK